MSIALLPLLLLGPPSPIGPEQLLALRRLSEPRVSPDGTRVVVTVTEPPKGADTNRDLWLLDLRSREWRRLTQSPKSDSAARWSPDGRTLGFLSDRDGSRQIYLLPFDGGEPRRLTEGKNAVESFEWSPDGGRIAFLAPDAKTTDEEKKEADKDDAHVLDVDDKPKRLFIVDVKDGKPRALTSGRLKVTAARFIPGGRLVVSATEHPESDQETERIYSVAAADGAIAEIAAPRGPFTQLEVSPDGAAVAYVAARVDGPLPHDLYLQPLGGGPPRNLTGASLDRPILSYAWRPDGSLLALVATGFRSAFWSVTPEGRAQALPGLDVTPTAFSEAAGRIAFVAGTASEAPEVWLLGSTGAPERLPRFNGDFAALPLASAETLRYRSFDGIEIEAFLLRPTGAPVKAPTVVLVHSGPTGRWPDAVFDWAQLLVAHGYAVLLPNVRGSTGYGHRFLELNRADWGGGDFKDVLAGVDALVARGVADPRRVGIAGWSYGGYMAAWAVTQTQRFKAAVAGAGLSNLVSEFGTEESPAYDEWFYGLPYEKLDGFLRSSPIRYLRNARTPTLILHGEADTVDPLGQSQELYRGLKRYGVECQLVVYPREGHSFREEKHRLDVLRRLAAWFDAHLR